MQLDKKELHQIFIDIKEDKTKFDSFYEKYRKLIYGVVFSILKNREDSEDMVQNIFMKIFNLPVDKLPKENEATWLYSITKNETLNYLKKQRKDENIDEIYYISREDSEILELIDMETFNNMIKNLKKEEQEIIALKIISNLSFKEISDLLGKSVNTVKWKYYCSLKTLKGMIGNLFIAVVSLGIVKIRENRKYFDEDVTNNKNQNLQNNVGETNLISENDVIQNDSMDENRQINQKQDLIENESKSQNTTDGEIKDSQNIIQEDEENQEENILSDDFSNNGINNTVENVVQENTIDINTTGKNDMSENKTEEIIYVEKNNMESRINAGLYVVSGLFFLLAIIFLINFIKNQLNLKKKLSK